MITIYDGSCREALGLKVFVLGVIGSAVSAILGTLQELNAMNEASDRHRREVRICPEAAGNRSTYTF